MRLLLALFLSGCVLNSDIKHELVAHCTLGVLPITVDSEDSPYTLVVDGAVITIKCTEILE